MKRDKEYRNTWQVSIGIDCEEILQLLLDYFKEAPCQSALLTPQSITKEDLKCEATWPIDYRTFHWKLGVGLNLDDIDPEPINPNKKFNFEDFGEMIKKRPGYRMGYFSYEMEQPDENVFNNLPKAHGAPPIAFWFRPSLLIRCNNNTLEFIRDDHHKRDEIIEYIIANFNKSKEKNNKNVLLQTKLNQESEPQINSKEYLNKLKEIKRNIRNGDYYELNFCIEWILHNENFKPLPTWAKLTEEIKSPFSAYVFYNNLHILSLSPERFLKRQNDYVLSQPIKGTIKRKKDLKNDQNQILKLYNSTKDRAEHNMIVDLMRNDLTQVGDPISIKALELHKISTFNHIHHMISTIQVKVEDNISAEKILKPCFPPGSMTGAPKKAVCKKISELENKKRGVFSGIIGYVDENAKNFDFNIVIRTIIYDVKTKDISVQSGGAITIDSESKREWEECLVKTKKLLSELSKNSQTNS